MDAKFWTKKLKEVEAEAELGASRRRSDMDAATKKLQRAKAELKRLEATGQTSTSWPERESE